MTSQTPRPEKLNLVPFVSVDHMMKLVHLVGVEAFLSELAGEIEADFLRWPDFDKTPRVAAHSTDGVIELMPVSDGALYGFKYVNGHPKNTRDGRQTVTAFGVLSDVATGYPLLLSEMTILTALRTAATSALAARRLARPESRRMAIIGNGAQSEFQALAFKAICGVTDLRLYDIDPEASARCARNLAGRGFSIAVCASAQEAVEGADVVTTVTADKQNATILTDNMVGPGIHINAVGGDCPGKTELHPDVLRGARVFVEYEPQTRVEGDIQQLPAGFPVVELWRVLAGTAAGRQSAAQVTVFDSVGFALEDYSTLRYVLAQAEQRQLGAAVDLVPPADDPKDLFRHTRPDAARPLMRRVA